MNAVNDGLFFLDTAYVLALLNRHDRFHEAARRWAPRLRAAREVWTTYAVLIEIGNALSRSNRLQAVAFIRASYTTINMRVVEVDTPLLERALNLFASRADKTWGLTDCISFIVMQEHSLSDALTSDDHFRQAGFRPLLLDG